MRFAIISVEIMGLLLILLGCTRHANYTPTLAGTATTSIQTCTDQDDAPTPVSPISDQVPSYAEIQETIGRIIEDKTTLSDEQKARLDTYYTSLAGRKVLNWCGWVGSVQPDELQFRAIETPIVPYPFTLFIIMSKPKLDEGPPYTDLLLEDVPLEQVKELTVWHTPSSGGGLQKVLFNGVINYVNGRGLISISNAQIKLIR